MEKGHTQIRILQILSKFDNGGIESFIMNYYRSLDKNKFQFDFVCDENSTIPYENEIKKIAQLTEGVMNLGSLRTRKHGASAYVDLVICVDGKLTVTSGHDIATNLEKKIQNDINIVKGITVHVEPCNSCNEKRCNK